VLVVLGDRQLPQQIDLVMDDILHRRRHDLDPWQRMANGVLKAREQFARGNAERIRDPAAVGKQVRHYGNRMLAG